MSKIDKLLKLVEEDKTKVYIKVEDALGGDEILGYLDHSGHAQPEKTFYDQNESTKKFVDEYLRRNAKIGREIEANNEGFDDEIRFTYYIDTTNKPLSTFTYSYEDGQYRQI